MSTGANITQLVPMPCLVGKKTSIAIFTRSLGSPEPYNAPGFAELKELISATVKLNCADGWFPLKVHPNVMLDAGNAEHLHHFVNMLPNVLEAYPRKDYEVLQVLTYLDSTLNFVLPPACGKFHDPKEAAKRAAKKVAKKVVAKADANMTARKTERLTRAEKAELRAKAEAAMTPRNVNPPTVEKEESEDEDKDESEDGHEEIQAGALEARARSLRQYRLQQQWNRTSALTEKEPVVMHLKTGEGTVVEEPLTEDTPITGEAFVVEGKLGHELYIVDKEVTAGDKEELTDDHATVVADQTKIEEPVTEELFIDEEAKTKGATENESTAVANETMLEERAIDEEEEDTEDEATVVIVVTDKAKTEEAMTEEATKKVTENESNALEDKTKIEEPPTDKERMPLEAPGVVPNRRKSVISFLQSPVNASGGTKSKRGGPNKNNHRQSTESDEASIFTEITFFSRESATSAITEGTIEETIVSEP